MAGVWIERRNLKAGGRRYIVRYRLGGAESAKLYGGSFRTRRDAEARERWIAGELAAMRVPDLRLLRSAPVRTLAQAAEGWLASRIDLAPNTLATHRKSIARAVSAFGQRDPASLIPAEIAEWVSSLAGELAPATIGKSLGALAQPARPPRRRAEPGP